MSGKELFYWSAGEPRSAMDPSPELIADVIRTLPAGSIFVSEGPTWISEVIGWMSLLRRPWYLLRSGLRAPYSHTGAMVGPREGEPFDVVIEAMPKGVQFSTLSVRVKEDKIVSVWSNIHATDKQTQLMRNYLELRVGAKYDWLAGLSFLLPVEQDDNAYNCIEVTVSAAKIAGLVPMSLDARGMTPVDWGNWLESRSARDYGWYPTMTWI